MCPKQQNYHKTFRLGNDDPSVRPSLAISDHLRTAAEMEIEGKEEGNPLAAAVNMLPPKFRPDNVAWFSPTFLLLCLVCTRRPAPPPLCYVSPTRHMFPMRRAAVEPPAGCSSARVSCASTWPTAAAPLL
jgi:hypothetical protein